MYYTKKIKDCRMSDLRSNKKLFKNWLEKPNWREYLPQINDMGLNAIGALFSFLPRDVQLRHRAAVALGTTVAKIAEKEPEAAKNICRRYMWHMNEDSGNIGWGIPEAFAETLVNSPKLLNIYGNILISYIMDLGHADNFCDQDILRRSCYWAVGRLAQKYPDYVEKFRSLLIKGLSDEDLICQGMAAWALLQLPSNFMDLPAVRKLYSSNNNEICDFFDNDQLNHISVKKLAEMLIQKEHEN